MLKKIEAALAAVSYPQRPEGLYEPIAYTLSSGGKRLRPTLLLLAYGLYRDDIDKAIADLKDIVSAEHQKAAERAWLIKRLQDELGGEK